MSIDVHHNVDDNELFIGTNSQVVDMLKDDSFLCKGLPHQWNLRVVVADKLIGRQSN